MVVSLMCAARLIAVFYAEHWKVGTISTELGVHHEAVERALGERRHLIVEAGTGTGKTLAYLLPALRTGQRVIIST